jgi:hypothetical protein
MSFVRGSRLMRDSTAAIAKKSEPFLMNFSRAGRKLSAAMEAAGEKKLPVPRLRQKIR